MMTTPDDVKNLIDVNDVESLIEALALVDVGAIAQISRSTDIYITFGMTIARGKTAPLSDEKRVEELLRQQWTSQYDSIMENFRDFEFDENLKGANMHLKARNLHAIQQLFFTSANSKRALTRVIDISTFVKQTGQQTQRFKRRRNVSSSNGGGDVTTVMVGTSGLLTLGFKTISKRENKFTNIFLTHHLNQPADVWVESDNIKFRGNIYACSIERTTFVIWASDRLTAWRFDPNVNGSSKLGEQLFNEDALNFVGMSIVPERGCCFILMKDRPLMCWFFASDGLRSFDNIRSMTAISADAYIFACGDASGVVHMYDMTTMLAVGAISNDGNTITEHKIELFGTTPRTITDHQTKITTNIVCSDNKIDLLKIKWPHVVAATSTHLATCSMNHLAGFGDHNIICIESANGVPNAFIYADMCAVISPQYGILVKQIADGRQSETCHYAKGLLPVDVTVRDQSFAIVHNMIVFIDAEGVLCIRKI